MAQKKREKEETELKVPETLTLCTPSISVTDRRSSPELSDLKTGVTIEFRPTSAAVPENETSDPSKKRRFEAAETSACTSPNRRVVNRCLSCKRKVGLIGFRCRCGDMFCSEHRYSDRHDCSYDYKAAGREAIARENPVVRAAKIFKV